MLAVSIRQPYAELMRAGIKTAEVRSREGLGLSSMGERVRLVRGELSVGSKPGQGTTVTVRVPATGDEP